MNENSVGVHLQASYRIENTLRDRKYGQITNVEATVETRELADKVRFNKHIYSVYLT